MSEPKKKFTKAEYKQMIRELYGAAELFWANRIGGTVAVAVLQKACEMTGDKYEPRPSELEESY
jgi:hypothetical protein